MPPAISYIDPSNLDRSTRPQMQAGEDERRQRAELYKRNWDYYDGNHKHPLKITDEGVDNNVIINLCAQIVDRMVAFLFPEFPTLDLSDGEPAKATPDKKPEDSAQGEESKEKSPAEKWLDDCWTENDGATALAEMATWGGVGGHNFVRIMPPDSQHEYPRLVILNGANVITYWRADDRDTVLWYEVSFTVGKETRLLHFINLAALFPLPIETEDGGIVQVSGWEIREYAKQGTRWILIGKQPWAWPLGPIYDWKHLPNARSRYGGHELTPAALNDAVNKVASDIKAILRAHASPKTIGVGMDAGDVQVTAIDSFWAVDNPDAKVQNLEMQSDLASSMGFLSFLIDAFMSGTRTVIIKGGPDALKGVTNLGIKAAFMDMVAKNEVLRRHYGKAIKELCRRLLMLGGFPSDTKVNISWPNPLPVSDLELTQIIQMQRDMKLLSKETASNDLALDFDQEQERIENEGDDSAALMEQFLNGGGPGGTFGGNQNNPANQPNKATQDQGD